MYPSIEDICELNRRVIETSGGRFVPPSNLANQDALEYALAIITVSGAEFCPYPSLKEKASALAYHIISRHVFWDGNKRTGIITALTFLKTNGVVISVDRSLEDLAVAIANGNAGIPAIHAWLQEHQKS